MSALRTLDPMGRVRLVDEGPNRARPLPKQPTGAAIESHSEEEMHRYYARLYERRKRLEAHR